MLGLLRADLLKTRKRAMSWVMLAIIAVFVPLQMLASALLTPTQVNFSFPGVLLQGVVPVPFVGILIMIILGGVLAGSEYGYDTWKNLLTRRAGRIPFLLSKWLVLIVAIGFGLLILLPLGLVIGSVLNATLRLTGPAVPLSLWAVLLLILLQLVGPLVAGSIAIMGAVIGRSSVAGIIAGIVWFLADALLGGLFPAASLSSSVEVLQAQVTGALMASNGSVAPIQPGGLPPGWMALVPGLVVVLYLVIPLAVAAVLFRRRDLVGAG